MLAGGHRLAMGEGIVGHAAQQRQYRVAMDVDKDAAAGLPFFDNPDLPQTRSEAALPLVARGAVIGVLDVQSTEPNAFGEEDMVALQLLANQVAVAVSNARLYWEAQQALESQRAAYGELSRDAWRLLLQAEPGLAIVKDEGGILPLDAPPDQEVRQALESGQAVVGSAGAEPPGLGRGIVEDFPAGPSPSDDGEGVGLAVPIRVRGQVIGAIDAHKPAGSGAWTPEQISLIETLTEQVGDALEDARLYRDAQRRAAREQTLAEVTGRMRESMNVDAVLQNAVREMRQALGAEAVELYLVEAE
jgi:GAF domain-containing protein